MIGLVLAMHGVNISVSHCFGHWFDLKASSTSNYKDNLQKKNEDNLKKKKKIKTTSKKEDEDNL